MFNLEQAIADWRQKMLAAGIETPVPLEELELHLREEMERKMINGIEAQQAFEEAVKSIGEAKSLKAEFKKLPEKTRDKFFRIAGTLLYLYLGITFLYMPLTDVPSIIRFSRMYISGDSSFRSPFGSPSFDLFMAVVELLWGILFFAAGVVGCRNAWRFFRYYPNLRLVYPRTPIKKLRT